METFNQEHKETKIKNINQGTYFRLKPSDTAPVWVRGEYNRLAGKYSSGNSMILIMKNS